MCQHRGRALDDARSYHPAPGEAPDSIEMRPANFIHIEDDNQMRKAIRYLLSLVVVIWTPVAPVPVVGLLPAAQPIESALLVVVGLVLLVRVLLIVVPGVIVLVVLVVVALVVLALPIFLIPVVLRAGSGHHRNRCSKGGSQKK
jgi:hypothetical protein